MTEHEQQQLEKIDRKLDGLSEAIAEIKINQERDLGRFAAIDHRFVEVSEGAAAALQLHDAQCSVRKQIAELEKCIDAKLNQGRGFSLAGKVFWGLVIGMFTIASGISTVLALLAWKK